MSRYKEWASRSSPSTAPRPRINRPEFVIPAPAPQPQPAATLLLTPAERPRGVTMVWGTMGRGTVERSSPIPPTVQLMKVDSGSKDPYEVLLSKLPDLARQAGLPPPTVDAMKMTGNTCGAPMEKWKSTSRYYTGMTDSRSEGDFESLRRARDLDLLPED